MTKGAQVKKYVDGPEPIEATRKGVADDSENRSLSSEQKHVEAADCDGALSVYDSTQLPVHSELCSPIQHDNGECLKNNEPGRQNCQVNCKRDTRTSHCFSQCINHVGQRR